MAAITRAEEYHRRALAIDPDLISSRRGLVIHLTERGELTSAYQQAHMLVTQRPDSGDAHFSVGYVLRYAGLLDEATRECEVARQKDPTNPSFRSCALPYALLGNYDRALSFAALDGDSFWARTVRAQILMLQGRLPDAVREAAPLMQDPSWQVAALRLRNAPSTQINAAALAAKDSALSLRDGEPSLWSAGGLAAIGDTRDALDLLRAAVARGYCIPPLDHVHAYDSVRNTPEFQQIRKDAIACQQRFLQWRAANAP